MKYLAPLLIAALFGVGSLCAASGDLYESEMTNNGASVYRYSPGGTRTLVFADEVRNYSLAFDKQGNLFVADYNNTNAIIIKMTPSGTITTFTSGLQTPHGLAFDEVR